MLPSRIFGRSGIEHSVLVFGSMRLDPNRLSPGEAETLLRFLIDAGVNAFHSSHEYDTHAFFCEMLRRIRPKAPVHVIKLGEPHFDQPRFRPGRFVALIERQLKMLQTERIAIVQWLLRTTPNIDEVRLPLLSACIEEVEETAVRLQEAGKIGVMAVFPYSVAVADFCLRRPSCAGLVTYLNVREREFVPHLPQLVARGQGLLAIRPLAGGAILDGDAAKAIEEWSPKFTPAQRVAHALRWPLTHAAVSGVILSVSSVPHASEAVAALRALPSHPQNGQAACN